MEYHTESKCFFFNESWAIDIFHLLQQSILKSGYLIENVSVFIEKRMEAAAQREREIVTFLV